MKISVGTNIKEGPWGGGNLFAINLTQYLEKKGHTVINHLDHEDIDLILLYDFALLLLPKPGRSGVITL